MADGDKRSNGSRGRRKRSRAARSIRWLAAAAVQGVVAAIAGKNTFWWYLLGFTILVTLGLGVWFSYDGTQRAESFLRRLRGPDLRRSPVPIRVVRAVGGDLRRLALRCTDSIICLVLGTTALFTLVVVAAIWIFTRLAIGANPLLPYVLVFGVIWAILGFVALAAVALANRFRANAPRTRLRSQILDVVESYPSKVLKDPGEATIRKRMVRKLLFDDPGPVRVQTVNAGWLTRPGTDGVTQVERAIQAGREVRWLITDAVSAQVRKRANDVNGKYLELYLIPFLRLLRIWEAFEGDPGTAGRLQIKTQGRLPHLRMMLSSAWLLMDPYSDSRGAREAHGIGIPRVFTIDQCRPLVTSLAENLKAFRAGASPDELARAVESALDVGSESLSVSTAIETMYGRFSDGFDSRWNDAEATPLTRIEQWDDDRLRFTCTCLGVDYGTHAGTRPALAAKIRQAHAELEGSMRAERGR